MAKNSKAKSNFSLRRLIYNDKYLIFISLILAVIIWIVASINIGTDEAKTIKLNVPITLGDEISEQYGMEYYSLQNNVELNVTIKGPKYVIGQVTENDLTVNFDSSSVNRTGVQTIPILVTNNSRTLDYEITNTYPSSIEAFFDIDATKTVDVDVLYDESNIASGYVFGKPIIDQDKLVISGPQTYVDKIESVYVDVDFGTDEQLTKPFKADCPIQIKGVGIESNYLSIAALNDPEKQLKNVSVTIPVLKETSLPVSVAFENAPENVDSVVKVYYSIDELNVGVLDGTNMKTAEIGKIDYTQLKQGMNEFEFDVTNLKGITILDNIQTVRVTVFFNQQLANKTVTTTQAQN